MAKSAVKRVRISKMQQHILLSVLGASVIFGVSIVFMIYFAKYISFNSKLIDAKDKAMNDYDKAISAVGICKDLNGDGKYTDNELEECDPNALDVVNDLNGTLRYNVMVNMANNMNLESVARLGLKECYMDGKKINFTERYRKSETDQERVENFNLLKRCSALRVVPDALPSTQNVEAMLGSLNQIFWESGWEPTSLAPDNSGSTSKIEGLETIPVSLTVSTDVQTTTRVLMNIERSIREFDIKTAKISWQGADTDGGESKLELMASADAYYAPPVGVSEEYITVIASKKAKQALVDAREDKK